MWVAYTFNRTLETKANRRLVDRHLINAIKVPPEPTNQGLPGGWQADQLTIPLSLTESVVLFPAHETLQIAAFCVPFALQFFMKGRLNYGLGVARVNRAGPLGKNLVSVHLRE